MHLDPNQQRLYQLGIIRLHLLHLEQEFEKVHQFFPFDALEVHLGEEGVVLHQVGDDALLVVSPDDICIIAVSNPTVKAIILLRKRELPIFC